MRSRAILPYCDGVLDNLVANALEHSPAKTAIHVAVSRREEGIELRAWRTRAPESPSSSATGVFEKFARLELKKAGVSSNRGLGLTFCRLGGRGPRGTIWVEEAGGGGALFRVLLPTFEAEEMALTA